MNLDSTANNLCHYGVRNYNTQTPKMGVQMPGNEKAIVKFLLDSRGSLTLPHLGKIVSVKNPTKSGTVIEIDDIGQLQSDDARKKADVILNDRGVSIKQSGSSFLYNRLQRADLEKLFRNLKFDDPKITLERLDKVVLLKNLGQLDSRDRPWSEIFQPDEFKALLRFLMMEGSPNYGVSQHPADLILSAPGSKISKENIKVFSFEEFVTQFGDSIYLTIRHQWIGQSSKSEHARALSISKKPGNAPWVFSNLTGTPSTGWRPEKEFAVSDRREVYMLFIQLILK